MPPTMPLLYRVSATDWLPEGQGWDIQQTIVLAKHLVEEGVDLIDVSSGGNHKDQKIPSAPGFQVPLASAIKKAVPNLFVGAVGLITDGKQANEVRIICHFFSQAKVDIRFWKMNMRMLFLQRGNF
jgi:2,4-dienoyl-CoA reductase-like NADH-dependent reductase (Old Yellow Enzyme family)